MLESDVRVLAFRGENDDDGEFLRCVVVKMANWPQSAGWPGLPRAQQQQPTPPIPSGKNPADFRPVSPFLQHSPRLSSPGFHQFPPRGSGPPPGPRGQAVYGNVYPSGTSPGFNGQRWSPNPRGYPATVPGFRPSSPNVIHARSQILLPGSFVSVAPPSQSYGPDQQPGRGPHDSRKASVVVPWSNDLRRNSGEPLFLNWIDESVKSSSVLGDSSDRASSLKSSAKSSDLYSLVDIVEDTVGKILALTDLQNSGTEWGVCPFNSRHVVPVEALLRHTLQCAEGSADASSLLQTLQYPHTVDLDPTEPVAHDERKNDCLESNSNYATLSFEDTARLSVNYTPISKFENLKQESGDVVTENLSETARAEMKEGTSSNWSEMPECRILTLSKSRQQFDPRGSLFFYGEAPGVVLTSLGHCLSKGFDDPLSSMPASLRLEIEKCPYLTLKSEEMKDRCNVSSTRRIGYQKGEHYHHEDGVVKESSSVRVLPSVLWSLRKELNSWKDTPSLCSRTVLEAATSLGGVRKVLIVEWLLVHSLVYGVVLDVAMASHISCLVQLFLKALRTQSLMLLDQSGLNKRDTSIKSDTMVIECPIYAGASTWLASLLSHLYGPNNSKAIVLGILKHCLKACGRFLLTAPLDLHSQHGKVEPKTGDVKVALDNEFKVFMEHGKVFSNAADTACVHVSNLEEVLEVKQIGAAIDALYERVHFERYIKSGLNINNVTKTQRLANYDMAVSFASSERAKRPNYRAVCEHDGLTWQRSQQQEKRNKTKAELLAEERDYKRRRMSYRGKKLKRTPLQILHDIIENHMTEISEAGGIGCFSKQPLENPSLSHMDFESQQRLQGSIPKTSNFQHHSESAHHSKTTSTLSAGSELRLYDEHRETSSVFKHDFRFRSQSRHDDQRYHNSRR